LLKLTASALEAVDVPQIDADMPVLVPGEIDARKADEYMRLGLSVDEEFL